MLFIIVSLITLAASGGVAWILRGRERAATIAGATGAVLGCAAALPALVRVLLGGEVLELRFGWAAYGQAHLRLDAIGAWFLLAVLAVSAAAAVYGSGYLHRGNGGRSVGGGWLGFNLLVASMAAVLVAWQAWLFLVAWEVMALTSFFLVVHDDADDRVREAGWIYLVATHLGTAVLLAFFLIMVTRAGTSDFDAFPAAAAAGPCGGLFLMAVIGFGTKAGFVPLHVWLPEAHPAAPSHVSAVMSGVMIKTGIYGVIRAIGFLGAPAAWWGWLLIAIGVSSGVLGMLFALAQHDVKRLLAYSSVENVGIITLGLGLGLLAVHADMPTMAALAFAGALLHVLNHAAFKSLLFMAAGAVAHATGTREIDALGGLRRRMPRTAAVFLVGAVAISGLPPLNGFVGELLLYAGGLHGAAGSGVVTAAGGMLAMAALAFIGGLAAAGFTKAFGTVFLGEPRTDAGAAAHDPPASMRWPMAALAFACIAIGAGAPWMVGAAAPAVATLLRSDTGAAALLLAPATGWMLTVVIIAGSLLALLGVLALVRAALLRRRRVAEAGTWDCGYARPTSRIQYTGSSFADPLIGVFWPFLRTRRDLRQPQGYFPQHASLSTHTPDLGRERLFRPAFRAVRETLARLRWIQHGGVHRYVLYVALALVALLTWKL